MVSGFAVDSDAGFPLPVLEGECGFTGSREDGRREADSHGAGAVDGTLRDFSDFVEVVAALGRGPGGFIGEDEAGDTAAIFFSLFGRGEDVVGSDHCCGADAVTFGKVSGEIEIVDVAAVVAV